MKNVIRTREELVKHLHSHPEIPIEIRRKRQGKRASIRFDDRNYYFITMSGSGLNVPDPEVSPIVITKSTSDVALATILQETLDKSRFIAGMDLKNLIESRVPQDKEKQWETTTAKEQGYKNRSTFIKNLKSVWVHWTEGQLSIFPTRGFGSHKAIGLGKDQTIILPGDSPPEEIGAAVRLGFERWQP